MVRIEDVTKEYTNQKKEKTKVLDHVSLSIEDGEVIALLGHNGSGKSTLIKCICGVIKPDSGKIEIDGQDAFVKRKRLIRNLGVIFNQKPSFIADLSVSDNLRYFKAIYHISDQKFHDNIDWIDGFISFKELLDKPYRKLSFGERVKCEIVSILLHDPQYIYMDEPTIGLDYTAKKGLYQLLAQLKEKGTTILIATHEVDYIEGICDRAVILSKGRIRYEGNPKNVMDRLNSRQNVIIQYEDICDEEKALAFEKTAVKVDRENKMTLCMVSEGMQRNDIINAAMQAYHILAVKVEDVSIREVLEDVLEENR